MIVEIIMLIAGVFYIATSSAAIQCYRSNEVYKNDNTPTYNFIIVNLVSAILTVILAFVGLYLRW